MTPSGRIAEASGRLVPSGLHRLGGGFAVADGLYCNTCRKRKTIHLNCCDAPFARARSSDLNREPNSAVKFIWNQAFLTSAVPVADHGRLPPISTGVAVCPTRAASILSAPLIFDRPFSQGRAKIWDNSLGSSRGKQGSPLSMLARASLHAM